VAARGSLYRGGGVLSQAENPWLSRDTLSSRTGIEISLLTESSLSTN
jgi:hypothetical protein